MSDRLSVLTFLSNFLIGGTERQVVNLVRSLDPTRFDLHMACFKRRGPLLEEVDHAAMAFSDYPIDTLASVRTLGQVLRLARYVRARGIDVVHSYGFYANVFAIPAARLGGARAVVASIRDTGDHLTRRQRLLQRWTCRAADHVLVNATAVKTQLMAEGYDASRISVIRNGIDVTRFRRAGQTPSGHGLRASLGLPASAPIVAVVARLNRLKGIEYFLDAAVTVAGQCPSVRFVIVGDSISQAYRDELEAYAVARGLRERVVFTGFRSDVPELLSDVPRPEPWPFDPKEGGRLLDEAGWKDVNGDGVRERAGVPFRFTLSYPAGSQEVVDRIAVWLQQSLAESGVRMDIEKLEWKAFQS